MRRAILTLTAAVGLAAFAGAPSQDGMRELEPGEGVLCAMVMYAAVADIAATCSPDKAPETQAELRRQVERLEAYALANGMTADQVATFRSANRLPTGDPAVCATARGEGYESALEVAPSELRRSVDGMVASPGRPTWGSCL